MLFVRRLTRWRGKLRLRRRIAAQMRPDIRHRFLNVDLWLVNTLISPLGRFRQSFWNWNDQRGICRLAEIEAIEHGIGTIVASRQMSKAEPHFDEFEHRCQIVSMVRNISGLGKR